MERELSAVDVVEPAMNGCKPELMLLLSSMRSQLLGSAFDRSCSGALNWDEVTRLAQDNRWLLVLARALGPARTSGPPKFWSIVERYRALTLKLNGANLMSLRTTVAAFARASIDVLVLKGPSAQLALYGDCFVKPSTDVDLLVRRGDLARAAQVVETCGFRMPADCANVWWRVFLGEQHYLSKDGATIDLHHRIQQPGCPSPKLLDGFFNSRSYVAIGSTKVPVLSRHHACLLSSMSLVKAMANREPAGAHAADIAAHLARSSAGDLRVLLEIAEECGLFQTLCVGLRAARVLFGVSARGVELDHAFEFLDDGEFLVTVMEPQAITGKRASRTEMLWGLSEGVGMFAGELAWKFAAEAARIVSSLHAPAAAQRSN